MKKNLINNILICFVLVLFFSISACGKSKKTKVYLSESGFETLTDSEVESTYDSSVLETVKDVLANEEYESTSFRVIYVQVNGAVNKPGVYKIEEEMRVFQVIDLAGGITADASVEAVNMARPVNDEMVIYIPTKEEVSKGFTEQTEIIFEDYEINDSTTIKRVNINTASLEELMTLSGIGEVKAKQIIEYRKMNGNFTDISQIMNISGIKQTAYDKIKDYITV